jgi:hypothetical protein
MSSTNKTGQLSRLVYASRSGFSLSMDEFLTILHKSRDNNQRNGVTGVLAYGDRHFMQILEGNRRLVSQTYSRIIQDTRHSKVELLDFSGCSERYFSDWSMQHQCVRKDILAKMGIEEPFRPQNWTADKCIHFAIRYSTLLNTPLNEADFQLA